MSKKPLKHIYAVYITTSWLAKDKVHTKSNRVEYKHYTYKSLDQIEKYFKITAQYYYMNKNVPGQPYWCYNLEEVAEKEKELNMWLAIL